MFKKVFLVIGLIFLIGIVKAQIEIGIPKDTVDRTINLESPPISIYTILNTTVVNSSQYADIWVTAEGNKDDVSDISTSELTDDNTYVRVNGDTMTGSLGFTGAGSNLLHNVEFDMYPQNQLTIGLRVNSDTSNLILQALGTETILLSDNLTSTKWFNGQFNWTSADDWNIFDGSTLDFNESKLSTTFYNATQANAVAGTIDGGTLANTQHQDGNYDGRTFNFTEVSGSPGLDLRINFTGIDDFNGGVMRYKTSVLAGNYPIIQLWNYDDSVWEDYPLVGETLSFATIEQPVFDSTEHVQDGIVQMRLYKASNGNTNNHYFIDWVAISKGYGVPAGEEVDPYSIHRDGTIPLTNNWNAGAYKITMEGELILQAIATVQNVTPVTHNLYALGNSTHWFNKIYATNIYNENFYGTNINASDINSTDIHSGNMNTTTMEVNENITLAGHTIKKDGEDIILLLG